VPDISFIHFLSKKPTMKPMHTKMAGAISGLVLLASAQLAHAAGMLPESTVVLIDEADGEASMNVKNTDPAPSLLYATIQPVPEDKNPPVVLTPPVARVEPGKTQLVRFMLTNSEPLTVERYARVTFDGIPEKKDDGQAKVTLTVRQNMPIVIHPKSLAVDKEPWKHLKWYGDGGKLTVFNDSAYVVRIDQKLVLQPGNVEASIGKTYLVPGERAQVHLAKDGDKSEPAGADFKQVEMTPFTAYGYAAPLYPAAIGLQPQAAASSDPSKKTPEVAPQ
jgi:P pilus assembly chaperone PapD